MKRPNDLPAPLPRAAGLRRGARAVVTCVEGSAAAAERLAALGLVPGTAFTVLRGGCPMTVAFGEARIALGRAWAEALVVAPA